MAVPVGAQGRATYNTRAPASSTANKTAIKSAGIQNASYQNNRYPSAYLNALAQQLYGGMGMGGDMGGFGGGGGGSRGGGGGGYGGGGGSYDAYRIAQEEERRRQLEAQKAALTQQLTGARDAAIPQLDAYAQQYAWNVNDIYSQNQAQVGGYQQQLAALAAQINAATQQRQQSLQGDMQGQGAVGPEMMAMQQAAQGNQQGNDFLANNAQQYQLRLAQMMAAQRGDQLGMGSAIDASSRGQLQNSYANALAQIAMMGLGQ
jgi:hypothetical protein